MQRPLTTLLAFLPLLASAQAGLSDAPGPAAGASCGAFVVGPCVARSARAPAPPATPAAAPPAESRPKPAAPAVSRDREPSDVDVDSFIANHGKPPREVARAMVDPTDENIAAMMRRLQRDHAIAAYVGQRMTELQQSDPSLATAGSAVPFDLPAFTGVRLLLVTQPDCPRCDRAAQALQRLVSIYPTLDARIAVAGVREGRQVVQEMARTGVTLPTTAAEEALLQRVRRAPPFLLVADVRRQREGLIIDVEDAERLRLAVMEFQRAGAPRPAPRPENKVDKPAPE